MYQIIKLFKDLFKEELYILLLSVCHLHNPNQIIILLLFV